MTTHDINKVGCYNDGCENSGVIAIFENRLFEASVETIGDALKLGESGLLKIYGIGVKCIEEINYFLNDYNIQLKQ